MSRKHFYKIYCVNPKDESVEVMTSIEFDTRHNIRRNAVGRQARLNQGILRKNDFHKCQGVYVFYEEDYKKIKYLFQGNDEQSKYRGYS